MIAIKQRKNEPEVLSSQKVASTKAKLLTIVSTGYSPKSKDFDNHWLNDALRNALWKQQHKKCVYCELVRGRRREIDVEHFRPKAQVAEDKTHLGYWWLAYEWENLLYACKYCNQEYKKNHFPLLPQGKRAMGPGDDLLQELPMLLNPYEDEPEDCLGYEWVHTRGHLVEVVGVDEEGKGDKSVEMFGLNRHDLAEQRAYLIECLEMLARTMDATLHHAQTMDLTDKIQNVGDKIKRATSSKRNFSGFRRYYFRSRGLAAFVSQD